MSKSNVKCLIANPFKSTKSFWGQWLVTSHWFLVKNSLSFIQNLPFQCKNHRTDTRITVNHSQPFKTPKLFLKCSFFSSSRFMCDAIPQIDWSPHFQRHWRGLDLCVPWQQINIKKILIFIKKTTVRCSFQ